MTSMRTLARGSACCYFSHVVGKFWPEGARSARPSFCRATSGLADFAHLEYNYSLWFTIHLTIHAITFVCILTKYVKRIGTDIWSRGLHQSTRCCLAPVFHVLYDEIGTDDRQRYLFVACFLCRNSHVSCCLVCTLRSVVNCWIKAI